jgi:hypothetical protein
MSMSFDCYCRKCNKPFDAWTAATLCPECSDKSRLWTLIGGQEDDIYLICHPEGWCHTVVRRPDGWSGYLKPRAQQIVDALNLKL